MRWGTIILTVSMLIALVLVSGCADVSFGQNKIGDFGSTKEEQKAIEFFKGKYGDPLTNSGPPRFLEPVISTGLVNKTPVDNVTRLNKGADRIYFWVFYDNFQKGDPLTINWIYNGKTAGAVQNVAGGKFGRAYGEFIKPDTGWPAGIHEIMIVGKGTRASTKFEIVDGTTDKGTPPFLNVRGLTWLNPQPEPPAPGKLAMLQVENQTTTTESTCPSGTYACGNVCSQLQYDEHNCGTCGFLCSEANSEICYAGNCLRCPSGSTYCKFPGGNDAICADLMTAPEHCGACNYHCQDGQTCQNGQCTQGCIGGLTLCSGYCRDLSSDPANCGACGKTCPQGEICHHGWCPEACIGGLTLCSGYCRDLSSDPANCGACGFVCSAGQTCQNGLCIASTTTVCPENQILCNNVCTDAYFDINNCGKCGNKCPSGSWGCMHGICVCGDTNSNPLNCGSCGHVCPQGQTCQNGQCMASQQTVSCPQGQLPCVYSPGAGYLCTNVGWDNSNCGTCGVVCGSGTTCQNGQCIASATASCPTGQKKCGTGCVNILSDYLNCGDCGQICSPGFGTCCNGQCPNTWTDPTNCGSCGHVCLQGQTCINGQCLQTCASGTTSCSGICVNTQNDSNNCGYCGNKCSSIQYCSNGACIATGGGIVRRTDIYVHTNPVPIITVA